MKFVVSVVFVLRRESDRYRIVLAIDPSFIKVARAFVHQELRAANTITTTHIIIHNGTTILNFVCLVLCLNIFIPSHDPIAPPRRTVHNNTHSLILYSFWMALFLSIQYNANAMRLIITR